MVCICHLSVYVCMYVCMYLGPIDKFSTAPILLLLMCIHYSSPKLDSSCTNLTVKTKVRQWVLNHLVWFVLFFKLSNPDRQNAFCAWQLLIYLLYCLFVGLKWQVNSPRLPFFFYKGSRKLSHQSGPLGDLDGFLFGWRFYLPTNRRKSEIIGKSEKELQRMGAHFEK